MKWFKHISDASEDLFIQDIESKFGDFGYAFWFKTLELIALHGKDGVLEISWNVYQKKLHKRRTQVELLLNFCSTYSKLNFSSNENTVIISCKKFTEMTDNYTKYGKTLQRDLKETEKKQTIEVEEEKEVEREEERTYGTETNFNAVWSKYPNRQGKKDALRHFRASVKTEDDLRNIVTALENYLKSQRVKNGYVKNGSTWFNDWQSWINPTEQMIGVANASNFNGNKPNSSVARATYEKSPEQVEQDVRNTAESIRLLRRERS